MDIKTFKEVQALVDAKLGKSDKQLIIELEQQAIKAEKKLEDYQLIALYASDIVEAWPTLTMRTLRSMVSKMETLKQALIKVKP